METTTTPTDTRRPVATTTGHPAWDGDGPGGARGRSGRLPDVLVEGPAAACDLLVELIDTLREIDRLTARATDLVAQAQVSGEVEEATGLPLELWLSAAGRRTRADRRMLASTAELRERLPSLAAAFDAGRVSWAQVRAIVCACVKLPRHLLDAVDDAIAREIDALVDAEPDALVHIVSRAVSSIEPAADETTAAREARERFLAIQPRLDGTGGTIFGEADAYGLAVITEALDAGTPPPERRLRDGVGQDADDDRRTHHRRTQGRRRMDALIAMAERSLLAGHHPGLDRTLRQRAGAPRGDDGDATPRADTTPGTDPHAHRRPLAPTLLLTLPYDSLVGASNEPGAFLSTVTGGRLKVAADTARRLVDEAGAQVRTIVLDETGQVLGVGRRTYRPPGWLRDALLVRDETCRAPGCLTSARRCDVDHADPWSPADDRASGGPTDVVNLAHVCRTDHTAKSRDGWHVYGFPDGPRRGLHRWRHHRTGLTVDTIAATRTLPLIERTRAGPSP